VILLDPAKVLEFLLKLFPSDTLVQHCSFNRSTLRQGLLKPVLLQCFHVLLFQYKLIFGIKSHHLSLDPGNRGLPSGTRLHNFVAIQKICVLVGLVIVRAFVFGEEKLVEVFISLHNFFIGELDLHLLLHKLSIEKVYRVTLVSLLCFSSWLMGLKRCCL